MPADEQKIYVVRHGETEWTLSGQRSGVVFAARWLGLPATDGRNFLLDPGTLSIPRYYRGLPAIRRWNAQPTA